MNIYAYQSHGYEGLAIRIQVTTSARGLTLLGLSQTQQREFRQKAASISAALGVAEPTGIVQVPPKSNLESLELAIMLALRLSRDRLLPSGCPDIMIAGKLNLDGTIAPMPTLLAIPELAYTHHCRLLIAPTAARPYTYRDLVIRHCADLEQALRQCRRFLLNHGGEQDVPASAQTPPSPPSHPFAEILGLEKAKRALQIVAAGGLNILLYGPPGGGKTLLLHTLASLMPPLTEEEKEEIARIRGTLPTSRPVIEVLPTMAEKQLFGSEPSLLNLAHGGILLVDELNRQKESTLKAITFFLEKRNCGSYPGRFILASAMNGCPCGNMGREEALCTCSEKQRQRHWSRIGSALLDRFDICLPILPENLMTLPLVQEEQDICANIRKVWLKQRQTDQQKYLKLLPLLDTCKQGKSLSMRCSISVCKIATIIAHFSNREVVDKEDMSEALSYKTYGIDRHWR